MADAVYARSAGQTLDRLIQIIVQELTRSGDSETKTVHGITAFGRREFIRAGDQLLLRPEGLYKIGDAFWVVRYDPRVSLIDESTGRFPNPLMSVSRTVWLIDDEGAGWIVDGIEPIGRRRHLQLSAKRLGTRSTPPPTPNA